jgi:hypothetical protein
MGPAGSRGTNGIPGPEGKVFFFLGLEIFFYD